jgi:hypothetical protein
MTRSSVRSRRVGDSYTIAGGRTALPASDGPAPSAGPCSPERVAVDSSSNVVVADTGNNRVRLVAENNGTCYGVAIDRGDLLPLGRRRVRGNGGPCHFGVAQFAPGSSGRPHGEPVHHRREPARGKPSHGRHSLRNAGLRVLQQHQDPDQQCPGGGKPLGQSVVHHGKRGKPVGPALAVAGYTVDANSCSGLSLSGPVNYKLVYLGQPNGFEVSRARQSISFGSTNPSPAAVGKPTQSLVITFR